VAFNNTGTVNIASSSALSPYSGGNSSSPINVPAGATLNLNGTFTFNGGGGLSGDGTVNFNGGPTPSPTT